MGSSTSTLFEIKACEELPLGQKKHTNILNKTRETVFKLEGEKLSEITMVNPILIVVVLITASIGPYIGTSFALHDSTLGVNTWLASDNSTQLNTIDLNNGPTAPTADAGAAAETEDDVVEDDEEPEETPTDENETDEEEE